MNISEEKLHSALMQTLYQENIEMLEAMSLAGHRDYTRVNAKYEKAAEQLEEEIGETLREKLTGNLYKYMIDKEYPVNLHSYIMAQTYEKFLDNLVMEGKYNGLVEALSDGLCRVFDDIVGIKHD